MRSASSSIRRTASSSGRRCSSSPLLGYVCSCAATRALGIALATGFLMTLYLNGSFQTWTTAGAFGARRFIVCSPIFAVGLAEVFHRFGEQRGPVGPVVRRWVPILAALVILWNCGLIVQFVKLYMDRQQLEWPLVFVNQFTIVPRHLVGDLWRFVRDPGSFYQRGRFVTQPTPAAPTHDAYDDAYFAVQIAKSDAKVRWEYSRLIALGGISLPTHARVLDAACGAAPGLRYFDERVEHVVGLDVSASALHAARGLLPDAQLVQADLDAPLPFGDRTFDLIVLREAIEHVRDGEATLRHCLRALRPGGCVAITTPNLWDARRPLFRAHAPDMERRRGPDPHASVHTARDGAPCCVGSATAKCGFAPALSRLSVSVAGDCPFRRRFPTRH